MRQNKALEIRQALAEMRREVLAPLSDIKKRYFLALARERRKKASSFVLWSTVKMFGLECLTSDKRFLQCCDYFLDEHMKRIE
jgi:hypothetical protein